MPSLTANYTVWINPELVPPELEAPLLAKLSDFSPVLLDEIGTRLQSDQDEWFQTQGYGSWVPLSPATIREKQRLGYPEQPLVRKGFLASHIGEHIVLQPTNISVGIDPDIVPYARYQNAKRLLVTLTDEERVAFLRMIANFVGEIQGLPPNAVQVIETT